MRWRTCTQGQVPTVVGRRSGVAVRPNGGEARRSDAAQAATVYIYVAYVVAADTRDFMGGTCLSGS